MHPSHGPYREILRRLRAVVRTRDSYDLLRGSMHAVAAAAALVTAAVAVEQAFQAGQTLRFWIFTTLVAGSAAAAAWFAGRPALRLLGILRAPDPLEVAKFVGGRIPEVRDRLVDAMEMFPERERLAGHYSPELIDAAFAAVWEEVRDRSFTAVVNPVPARRAARVGAAAAVAVTALFLAFPGWFGSSLGRIARYDQAFASERTLALDIAPGDIEVVRGQPVSVTVRASGPAPRHVLLHTRAEGRLEFESVVLSDTAAAGGSGVYVGELPAVKATTEYYASARDAESERHTIAVLDRPIVKSFRLSVTPPAYTGMPARELEHNVGDVTALRGSTVRLSLTASKEVAAAAMVFRDGGKLALTASGEEATGSFRVRAEDRYRFRLEDGEGLTNPDPIEYAVRPVPDEHPLVEITAPGKNLDVTGSAAVPLAIRIRDDYGFSSLRLLHRMEHSRYEQPSGGHTAVEIPLPGRGAAAGGEIGSRDVHYLWDISKLSLVPEDVVSYHVEVFDNDAVTGPKSARSLSFLLRLPSLEEVLADVDRSADRSAAELQQMSDETRNLRESLEELNREVRKQRDRVDWQQQQKAEQLAERYQDLRSRAEEASKSLEETVRKMDDNRLLSESTLEKYRELASLMEELNSEELREALKKLQESMQKLTPEQLREAMDRLTMSEEQFRKNLERTVELLKRIHIEQKLDELIRRADALRERQDELAGRTTENAEPEEAGRLGAEQSDMSRQAESLQDETAGLREKMEEFAKEMPLQEMDDAAGSLREKKVPETMREAASKMRPGSMRESRAGQQQASRDLSQFAQDMEEVRDALREKQTEQIVNEMRRQIQDLVDLSRTQEDVKQETSTMEPNSQRFRDAARRQQETREGLGSVADAMAELSKKTFAVGPDLGREMGNAMNRMAEAMSQIEARNPGESSKAQREAMGAMNRAAMMMQGALEGLDGSEGQMGMAGLMGRLGQMAGQQQGINRGTQQAGSTPGDAMSASQMAEYGRLAGEQGAVRRSLEELAAEAKAAGEFSKILGDLDRIAQEMQEVQTNLSQGEVNPETIRKQDRILSRLLESQKSMRERDYERRRTAETGRNVVRQSPATIDFGTQEGRNMLREELYQAREGRYARDYEELIRRYFERLERDGGRGEDPDKR